LADERCDKQTKVILLGNKCDLEEERKVQEEALITMGKEIGAFLMFEVSAKTGVGITEVLQGLGDGCMEIELDKGGEVRAETKQCC
jgi:GTPase SAR1 family protein